MIIALAGRRVDAVGAKQHRFPPENVAIVRGRIRAMLEVRAAIALVSSAACGADLLALIEAGSLGLRRWVVLPFEREKFRNTSVTDRPGDWGPLYDRVLNEVEQNGELLVIQTRSEDKTYAEVNHVIIDQALLLGQQLHCPVTAVSVWDGKPRDEEDLTEEFREHARRKDVPVIDVMTL